ncbi:GTP 3',8-cyclase MoaA, partial [Pseudomonas aeruginosa]
GLSGARVGALNLKPERHLFDAQEQVQLRRFMSMTGG